MRLSINVALLALSLSANTAFAETEPSHLGETFVEIGGGLGEVHAGSFEFINPQGAAFLNGFPVAVPGVSKVQGDQIVLDRQRRDASSPIASVSVGHFINQTTYVRATYRYLGSYHLRGSAAFPIDPTIPVALAFDQDYYLKGHALYLGIGVQKDVTPALFVAASAEAGAARLTSVSQQGANIGDPLGHPASTRTRFTGGGELGLGVHATRKLDVIFNAHADLLGTVMTGVVPADTLSSDGNFGINKGEQLRLHGLVNYGLGLVLRAHI